MNCDRRTIKVLYVVPPSHTYAGIERVIDEVCDELSVSDNNLEVEVLYTSRFENHPIENRRYRFIQRDTTSLRASAGQVGKVARGSKYDLIVVPQVEATVLYWLASIGSGKRFVLYLHGNPDREKRSLKSRLLFFLMHRLVLGRLAGVFGVAPQQLDAFGRVYGSKRPHFWVPNPVRRFNIAADPCSQDTAITFVNVGRFAFQKGQDILVAAFAKVHTLRPNVRLKLVGYGGDEPQLRAQIANLGLDDVISLENRPTDPQPALMSSDIYVSTSRWEGWPLAICEALRVGLPVIATNCDFGPSDILIDERLGRLVSDETALVQAMLDYHDGIARYREDADFRRDYVEQYSVEKVATIHAAALAQLAA